jgi:hypothetical protein
MTQTFRLETIYQFSQNVSTVSTVLNKTAGLTGRIIDMEFSQQPIITIQTLLNKK